MAAGSEDSRCIEALKDTRIKVKEHSRSAVFLNQKRLEVRKIKLDGCLVRGRTTADWIVSKANCVDVVVELKGRDVEHAVAQVRATLEFWQNNRKRGKNTKLAALIVCTQYPRTDTKVQLAKQRIARDFGAPLHVRTRNEEYEFCLIAEFKERSG
jgi:hypothetical protein